MPAPRLRPALALAAALAAAGLAGCGLAKSVAIGWFYDRVEVPAETVRRDLAYLPDGDPKHRLNLFLPVAEAIRERPWPVVVFVHGGGWVEGDRDFTYGGEDLYNNVGRFLASHGIGAAVVSYRLLPDVRWRAQVEDVAAATAWVQDHAAAWGGDPDAVVLMGHSAGAQLAARVALDAEARRWAGARPVCGAVPVSGAALDLTDAESWRLGSDFGYYAARFSPGRERTESAPAEPFDWQVEASPASFVTPDAPPFLIVTASGEGAVFERQADVLDAALRGAGVPSERVVMPAATHELGVPNLSRDDRVVGPAVLRFVRGLRCG